MKSALRHPFRVAWRLPAFLAVTTAGLLDHRWRLARAGRGQGNDPRAAAAWMTRWARNTMGSIGVRHAHEGPVPKEGLIVCNHLGYLDIPVLAASGNMVFVSKADVENWPLLGALARCGGTLFLKREQRSHVAAVADALAPIVESGTVVALFPEGTSSGGDDILPFRSSLLEPAASRGWPVTPAWVHYELEDGVVSEDVAYWREMTFFPHFLNLLAKRSVLGRVRYGAPIRGVSDRKELTRRLHGEVSRMMHEGRARRAR
ncbi:MAG: 1-acyl-sn-glycerol-3-phosphate acyltransferase [Verrucomicrobiales bacterium]|nr:1-acyl-sn-glycerol-3-phosphate acyltransferase [Verrucomicrobiales bacterium]